MGFKVIKVKPLSEQHALTLFLSKVGPNIVQNQTLMPILKLVVKECAGLPLTIVIVAGLQLEELPKEEHWSPDIEKWNPIKKIPNSFFTNMPFLSVLKLSFTKIERLPNSISELKNLTTLLLRGCSELRDLPCLSMLQKLKKLDLFQTKIEEVPEGMDMLIKLRYLDLGVFTLKEIPEIEPLKKLECLTVRFKDVSESIQQSKKNLIKYNLVVGALNLFSTSDKKVTIGGVQNWEDELIMHLIEIQELHIIECDYLRSLVDDNSFFKNTIDLMVFRIWRCEGIECVVSLSSFSSSSAHPFQSLEVLDLKNLSKLSALIMKDAGIGSVTTSPLAPSATFSHLKQIYVYRCSSMKTFLPHWLLPNLQNLEEIWVQDCDEVMVCDSLRHINVYNCDELKRIPPFVPLVGNGQPFANAPPSLTIWSSPEWWESLEWDEHPNFKNVLQPFWKDER
ncbi:hypothetical protein CXB51_009848 [Gossypium anomalum]|uniref:Disease resistance protein At4g27190-like leucine-rich repeats domain-containing protein n=1 Tax=Gossypium anomalum TaxID=47600 RepID=A0A8J5YLZ2_9ROSI|nr:hypothetical protein CXB51_009848 [Gossypium anomalum]